MIKFNFQFINKNLVSTLLKYFKKDDKRLFLNITCIEDDYFSIQQPFQSEKMALSYHNGSAKMVSQFLKLSIASTKIFKINSVKEKLANQYFEVNDMIQVTDYATNFAKFDFSNLKDHTNLLLYVLLSCKRL